MDEKHYRGEATIVKKVLVLVEGQTEDTFIRNILEPHTQRFGVHLTPILLTTDRLDSGLKMKGGVPPYAEFKKEILNLLHDTSASKVTTMIDFYGLPKDYPGKANLPRGSCFQRVNFLEEALKMDIKYHRKFLPYLSLHEFEAMLFVSPEDIARTFPASDVLDQLSSIKSRFRSPEEINDSPKTAPSKRLEQLLPEYRKPLHGPLLASRIGLERIRHECSHFDKWLLKLEALGES
jgi:hypothetical protein